MFEDSTCDTIKYSGISFYYSKTKKMHIKWSKTKYSKSNFFNSARRFNYWDCCNYNGTCEMCNPYKSYAKNKHFIFNNIIKESMNYV